MEYSPNDKRVAYRLKDGDKMFLMVDDKKLGVEVMKRAPGDPAGIKSGDIILEFERKEVKEAKDLLKLIS